jgi:hypothetical protein
MPKPRRLQLTPIETEISSFPRGQSAVLERAGFVPAGQAVDYAVEPIPVGPADGSITEAIRLIAEIPKTRVTGSQGNAGA